MVEDGNAGDNGYRGCFTEGIRGVGNLQWRLGGYPALALYDRRKVNAYGSFFPDILFWQNKS
jgi:hypothetical protein